MDTRTAYSWGVAAGLAGSFLHAGANILDSYLSNRLQQRLSALIALSATTNLLFVPLSAMIDPPQWIGTSNVAYVVMISCVNILYHFPYYWALQDSDTSVVSSLFSLGKLLTPPLAFLFLRETLAPIQYVGLVVIVIASALLTFERSRLRFRRALPYMFCVSFALILQAIFYKKLYANGVSWGTSVVWTGVTDFAVASLLLLALGRGRELASGFGGVGKERLLVIVNQLLTWGGEVLGLYALTLIPVSVFEGVGSGQPMFVLLLSVVLARRAPQFLKENLEVPHVRGKMLLFAMMVAGTVMLVRHD